MLEVMLGVRPEALEEEKEETEEVMGVETLVVEMLPKVVMTPVVVVMPV